MSTNFSRRQFLRTTSAAALATATAAPRIWAQGQTQTVIALVGVAHIHTPGFVDLIKGRQDVKVKAAWDPEAARSEKPAKELGARVVQDVKEIWSDPEIKAVVITSETNRHHQLVLAAAKAGKHMFAEKPLGITAKESVEMADAIEKAGLLFTTGYFM